MDKVKVILKHLQKHHFWLLSLVAIIASLVGWSMASSALSNVYNGEKTKITGKFTELQNIRSQERPPNQNWAEALNKLKDEQTEKVSSAWTLAYEQQKQLLKWPEAMGQDFLELVQQRPNDPVPRRYLNIYNSLAPDEFQKLLKIVNAEPVPGDFRAGGAGGGAQQAAAAPKAGDSEYTVSWDFANQKNASKLFTWEEDPSEKEMRQAQEDLWVYTALLNIIANMNKDMHVPRVKKIANLDIGKAGAIALAEGLKPGHLSNTPAAPGGDALLPMAGAPGEAPPVDEGRYVDVDGKKVAGEIAAKTPFKGMPVYMKLYMDQREIARLLTECANSPLPIDVTQLRINADKGSRSNRQAAAAGQGGGASDFDPYEVPVDLCGIIYIFNPPNMASVPDNLVVKTKRGTAGGAAAPGGPSP